MQYRTLEVKIMVIRKLLTVLMATAVLGFGGYTLNASAASVTGNGTAVIYTTLSIVQDTTMDFGEIAPAAAGDTVTLDTADGVTAGSVDTFLTGVAASGQFTVTGEGGLTYAITLPGSFTLTHTNTVNTMTVNALATSVVSPRTIPGALGSAPNTTDTFTVGADLTVSAGQLPGTYSGTYAMQVDYQ
jgi:hypothetical protein